MLVYCLIMFCVEKFWGCCDLWLGFDCVFIGGVLVGEVWFDSELGVDFELLVKYLFISEKLLIQVYFDDVVV